VIFGPLNLKARPLPSLPAAAGIRYGSLESPAAPSRALRQRLSFLKLHRPARTSAVGTALISNFKIPLLLSSLGIAIAGTASLPIIKRHERGPNQGRHRTALV